MKFTMKRYTFAPRVMEFGVALWPGAVGMSYGRGYVLLRWREA